MANLNVAIVGASGGVGSALVELFSADSSNRVHAFSRSEIKLASENVELGNIDYADESSIEAAAEKASQYAPLDIVIVATGILHDDSMMPERSLKNLDAANFEKNFLINTIGPALVAKHFLPKIHKEKHAVFAALSARVGSISDNRLGGWYAYRASKAALNMIIKTTSIEVSRTHKHAVVVGLHPGTVATELSRPFQKNVPEEKLFTAEYSARKLSDVINSVTVKDSGKIFAWDGSEIFY